METMSYSHMRQNLKEVLKKMEDGVDVCVTQKGKPPIIITATVVSGDLVQQSRDKFLSAASQIEKKHAKTITKLADK